MINEYQFNIILSNNYFDLENYNSVFNSSKLNKYIKRIYDITNFQYETLIIALYNINKIIIFIPNDKLKIFLFVLIILINKQLFDEHINVKKICYFLLLDFDEYVLTEILILKLLKWNIFINYNCENFLKFKKRYYSTTQLRQMDSPYNLDYLLKLDLI